jgi:aminopeptidase N
VGTYATYRRQLEYPDGDSFMLELLVFPNLVKAEDAETAIGALHDSVMWVYLSTGPEATEHEGERKELYELITKREALKKKVEGGGEGKEELEQMRAKAKQLVGMWKKTGYKYTGAVYREIAMENSDYGGMENVGNTTILSSRLVPSPLQPDAGYVYMEGVKVSNTSSSHPPFPTCLLSHLIPILPSQIRFMNITITSTGRR